MSINDLCWSLEIATIIFLAKNSQLLICNLHMKQILKNNLSFPKEKKN